MTTALTVEQAQHVNRARSLALARRLSDSALDLRVVCITIDAGATSIQLASSADAATVASRLGWTCEPAVEEHRGSVHHRYEHDVDGIVVRVVGLDPIDGPAA